MTSLLHLAATCGHCPACPHRPYFGRHPQPQQHAATTPKHGTGLLRSLTATQCNSSTLFLVGKETALILLPPLALSPPLLHFRNATSKDSCAAPLLDVQTPQGCGRSKAELRAGSVTAPAGPQSCKGSVGQGSQSSLAEPGPLLSGHFGRCAHLSAWTCLLTALLSAGPQCMKESEQRLRVKHC